MYEVFEHTADLGLRVRAPDREALFRDAADGLFAVIVEEVPLDAASCRIEIEVEAGRDDFLLVDWLSELLYVFETKHLLLDAFDVRFDGLKLSATARARPLDERRDQVLHEVKAVTYHGLRLERSGEGWLAEVILDI